MRDKSYHYPKLTYTSGGSRPLQTGVQIASLACQCCVLVCGKPIRVSPHRFTRQSVIEEKTFSVIKGKVWLPQAKFFPWCDRSQNGDRLNKMQINSTVICNNFIGNSIHVWSLSAQPPHTSTIVNATTDTKINILICSTWYTTHIHCTCRFSAIFRTMETFKGPRRLQVKLLSFS